MARLIHLEHRSKSGDFYHAHTTHNSSALGPTHRVCSAFEYRGSFVGKATRWPLARVFLLPFGTSALHRLLFPLSSFVYVHSSTHTISTQDVFFKRPKYALFPAKICFKSHPQIPKERSDSVRNAGRLKLGHYPLPVEEARNLSQLLIAAEPFFAGWPTVN